MSHNSWKNSSFFEIVHLVTLFIFSLIVLIVFFRIYIFFFEIFKSIFKLNPFKFSFKNFKEMKTICMNNHFIYQKSINLWAFE